MTGPLPPPPDADAGAPVPTSLAAVLQAARTAPAAGSVWIDLPQGPGASALVRTRLAALLAQGVSGAGILVLLPQRDRRRDYEIPWDATGAPAAPADGNAAGQGRGAGQEGAGGGGVCPEVHTYYSLAMRLVRLFWPAAAGPAGFGHPLEAPVQLTYETAQFVMSQVAEPFLRDGYFTGLALRPQRLWSQLLDNLNKAAVNGYDIAAVAPRLRAAWTGDGEHRVHFDQAQTCIEAFRAHCLAHNLLDVSLAVEVCHRHLLPRREVRAWLDARVRHLLVEGVEETVPVAQDFIADRLTRCDSAWLVHRREGGFRVFLGVDPDGAADLRRRCARVLGVEAAENAAPARALGRVLAARIHHGPVVEADRAAAATVARRIAARHRGDMVDAVAREVVRLVGDGEATPGQIAVVAPHADGVLRFLIGEALAAAAIPCAIVRRFESLREELEVRAALALAALAHDGWQRRPHASDVAEALGAALGVDPVRARLLTRAGYDARTGRLRPLDDDATLAERATPAALQAYGALRRWLEARRAGEVLPLDLFLRRLFGEVLSRPDLAAAGGATYARLIDSAAWFRRSAPALGGTAGALLGEAYAAMVEEGIVAAAPATPMAAADIAAVLVVAPVHTYLLEERAARVQFWLDVGAISWWEPPHQPLTNPHVLARRWPREGRWTDAVDYERRNQVLSRLVQGLCSRAEGAVYLCWSETDSGGEAGADTPLLRAAADLLGTGAQ